MSAHYDSGESEPWRTLREVEVAYVFDPTLGVEDGDSDSCPPTPPPTYYLRVQLPSEQEWAWRYVNVEKKMLITWDRRGGNRVGSVLLKDISLLKLGAGVDCVGNVLEVVSGKKTCLKLQARSNRETRLWASVMLENIEHVAGVGAAALEDETLKEDESGDCAKLAELLTNQLSRLVENSPS